MFVDSKNRPIPTQPAAAAAAAAARLSLGSGAV